MTVLAPTAIARRHWLLALAPLAAIPLATIPAAWAQDYPSKRVTFIVSFPPGSGADAAARLYASRMQGLTKQTFIVENRPGANSFLAAQAVARAAPDGYTLFFASNSPVAVNAVQFKKLPYDPVADFVPVARATRATNGIVVPTNSPYKTLAELAAAGKAKPHGAIGFTEEYDLQLFTRRLHAWRQTAGSESYWHDVAGQALLAHQGLSLDMVRRITDVESVLVNQ